MSKASEDLEYKSYGQLLCCSEKKLLEFLEKLID